MNIEHHNPGTLHRNRAFTEIVTARGAIAVAFIGGQNGVDTAGNVGDTLAARTEQASRNVLAWLR